MVLTIIIYCNECSATDNETSFNGGRGGSKVPKIDAAFPNRKLVEK